MYTRRFYAHQLEDFLKGNYYKIPIYYSIFFQRKLPTILILHRPRGTTPRGVCPHPKPFLTISFLSRDLMFPFSFP